MIFLFDHMQNKEELLNFTWLAQIECMEYFYFIKHNLPTGNILHTFDLKNTYFVFLIMFVYFRLQYIFVSDLPGTRVITDNHNINDGNTR